MRARIVRVILFVSALFVLGATPALADPAKPTDYSSRVDEIVPAVDGVHAEIVGGDAFLQVRVDRGHDVVVLGYGGSGLDPEPYLRFNADGTVEENSKSPAVYLNEDRYRGSGAPASYDAGAEPEWRQVDDDGEYAWHDHRIHWMSPERKEGIEPGDVVLDWSVPIVAEGNDAEIRGTLTLEHSTSPLPWVALGVVGAALVVFGSMRGASLLVGASIGLAAAIAALVVGWAQYAEVPGGAGAPIMVVVLPAVATGLALVAVVASLLKRAPIAAVASLAVAATLGGWAVLRIQVLWKPVLPTSLAFGLDRAGTTLALALSVGVAVLVVRSGALAPAPLRDEE